jgi:AraC family transcriptional regulator of adaptative response/methylated-DNA-[protein]-cysteine methyltransferase
MTDRARWTDAPCRLGYVRLTANDHAVTAIDLLDAPADAPPGAVRDDEGLATWREAVVALLADPARRPDLPLDPGGTPFQAAVWAAVAAIPVGVTRSYKELAAAIGAPGAERAVGAAVGRNPLAVVVPCHRVVGADGALRGYRWGVQRKAALLDLERPRLL